MLTGLLFAIEEAVGDSAQLVATLPFAGTTLIEHQARQLIAAGAGQIVILAGRRSPELLGAVHRISRRGVSLDAVSGAVEAAAALHPLARIVMLADGLVTTDAIIRPLAAEGSDALLVVPADDAPASFERIGGASAWAGVARLEVQRIADLAQLPSDYDPQATLVRLVEAAGAMRLPLPATALSDGHGVERDSASLARGSRRIVAAAVQARHDWFDRFVSAPLARVVMSPLVARGVETTAVAATAAASGVAGAVALAADWLRWGLLLAMIAMLVARVGIALAQLRDEAGLGRALSVGVRVVAAVAVLLLGWRCSALRADGAALTLAIALVAATILTERTGAAPALWWGGAGSYTLLVAVATVLGAPFMGLILVAGYAAVTLAASIEAVRQA